MDLNTPPWASSLPVQTPAARTLAGGGGDGEEVTVLAPGFISGGASGEHFIPSFGGGTPTSPTARISGGELGAWEG